MGSRITSGVFPVHANSFEVMTRPHQGETEEEWSGVAELEECTLTIENNIQEWDSFEEEGWGSALVTGKKSKIELKGKRCIGDLGNDFIAEKILANGPEAYVSARITHPNGNILTWGKMACGVSNDGSSGAAADVGALEAELTGHGKPKQTKATPST